jgi:hypothetical protein
MNSVIVVMMIWVGSSHGGPAMIQGFETIRACEAAARILYERQTFDSYRRMDRHMCMELPVK